MHFAKTYAEAAKDLPKEWHPYLISYKALKKCIGRIVKELEGRGLSVDLLKELQDRSAGEPPSQKFPEQHRQGFPDGVPLSLSSGSAPGHFAGAALVPAAVSASKPVDSRNSRYQQVLLDTDRQKLLYTFSDSSQPCLVVIVNEQPDAFSTEPTPSSTAPASPSFAPSPQISEVECSNESNQQDSPGAEVHFAEVLSERLRELDLEEVENQHPFMFDSLSNSSVSAIVELTDTEEGEMVQQSCSENDEHDEEEDRAHEEREQDEMNKYFAARGVFDLRAPSCQPTSEAPHVPVIEGEPVDEYHGIAGEPVPKRPKIDSSIESAASATRLTEPVTTVPSAATRTVYRMVRSRRQSRRYTTIYADDGQAVRIARGRRTEKARSSGGYVGSQDGLPKQPVIMETTDVIDGSLSCDCNLDAATSATGQWAGQAAAGTTKAIKVTLRTDVDFFNTILTAVTRLGEFQNAIKQVYEQRIRRLADLVAAAATPQQSVSSTFGLGRSLSDMYAWREIMGTFAEEEIWFDESRVVMRCDTVKLEKCRSRFGNWERLASERCLPKLKLQKSKIAFADFLKLNRDLLAMKQFRELNKMAIEKILKKHDKRTRLICRAGFEGLIAQNSFIQDSLTRALCYAVATRLMTIVPQPQDYSCPVCMSISWKPIRLTCGHVFCVRCLIKAQRRNMTNCPLCRRTGSVSQATANNLDVSLMNMLRLYFPREIKEKRRENAKEFLESDTLY